MTIKNALGWAAKKLSESFAGSLQRKDSVVLDAEILLAFALRKNKAYLYAHPEKKLAESQVSKFKKLIGRRVGREPIAYITGSKEFFGLDFCVSKDVLVPRPETEFLTEKALGQAMGGRQPVFVDVGTGSGCIAISLAKNLPEAKIYAVDSSEKALKTARKNARTNGVASRIKFLKGNLLEPLRNYQFPIPNSKLIIVANLPYLSSAQYLKTQPEIRNYEPESALVGGADGLDYYRELFGQIRSDEKISDAIESLIIEIDPRQARAIKKMAKEYWPEATVKIKKDLAGLDRMATVEMSDRKLPLP